MNFTPFLSNPSLQMILTPEGLSGSQNPDIGRPNLEPRVDPKPASSNSELFGYKGMGI